MSTSFLPASEADAGVAKDAKVDFRAALLSPEFLAFACIAALMGSAYAWNLGAGLNWAISEDQLLFRLALLTPIYFACRLSKATAVIAEILLFGALFFVMSLSLTKLTYLGFSLRFPLQDATFHRADAALGFDWNAWQAFLHSRPWLLDTLDWCYKSHSWQLVLAICALALLKPRGGNTFLLVALSVAGVLTAFVSALVPAIGPGYLAGWAVPNAPVIEAIRAGAATPLPMLGIVSFPSYHTVMAILFTYIYRDVKFLLVPAAVLNTLVLFSVPFSGNHFVVDIAGGALVAAVAIGLAGFFCKRFGGSNASLPVQAARNALLRWQGRGKRSLAQKGLP